jgi:hypothetical protein
VESDAQTNNVIKLTSINEKLIKYRIVISDRNNLKLFLEEIKLSPRISHEHPPAA